MDKSDLEPYVGKVAILDLVTGMQITTEVKRLYSSNPLSSPAEDMMEVGKIFVFQIFQVPRDPSRPAHPEHNPVSEKIEAIPYGSPFAVPQDERSLEITHIMFAHEPLSAVEKAYYSAATGIQVAGADALRGLKAKS